MDVIIVCHVEFGFVHNRRVIPQKDATAGVKEGVENLVKVADKYRAKVTFAVCPETVRYFPKSADHEIGLHIHPGWVESSHKGFRECLGDAYLKERCKRDINSAFLTDYSYEDQFDFIMTGKQYLTEILGTEPKVFVAGMYSENNDTMRALIKAGITHDCSPIPLRKDSGRNWSELPRICMPYHPSRENYQKKGDLPLIIVPTSQYFPVGPVNPEEARSVGTAWLKACFLEYYMGNIPLFHISLHSPCMTDPYFIIVMNRLLNFISAHKNINFKFASETRQYNNVAARTSVISYVSGFNPNIIQNLVKKMLLRPSFVLTLVKTRKDTRENAR